MDVTLVILFFLAAAVVVGIFGYLAYLAEKKRRESLAGVASQLGWRFASAKDSSHDEEYANFEIFRRGHSRAAYNTLSGTVAIEGTNCAAKMGDFRYKVTSGSGKSRSTRTYNFSYLIVHLPYSGLPALLIRGEGILDRMAGVFGFEDIDFESAEFSRKFYVSGSDKRFAYDVIHPRMMDFLLETNPPTIDIEHGRCCVSDGSRRWEPEQFHSMLQWSEQFMRLWPAHVKEDLK